MHGLGTGHMLQGGVERFPPAESRPQHEPAPSVATGHARQGGVERKEDEEDDQDPLAFVDKLFANEADMGCTLFPCPPEDEAELIDFLMDPASMAPPTGGGPFSPPS